SGATAIRFAAGARTFRERATKKPLTGGELRNTGTEIVLDDGEFAAVQRIAHALFKRKHTMRICSLSVPRLKDEWNQTVWSVNNLRCGTAGETRPLCCCWQGSDTLQFT